MEYQFPERRPLDPLFEHPAPVVSLHFTAHRSAIMGSTLARERKADTITPIRLDSEAER